MPLETLTYYHIRSMHISAALLDDLGKQVTCSRLVEIANDPSSTTLYAETASHDKQYFARDFRAVSRNVLASKGARLDEVAQMADP